MPVVKILNSVVAGNAPTGLAPGQIAINQADGIFFYPDQNEITQSFNFKTPSAASSPANTDNSLRLATTAMVQGVASSILASPPASLNTLQKLAAAINNDANFYSTVASNSSGNLRFDTSQTLNASQKTQVLANTGLLGSTTSTSFSFPVNTLATAGNMTFTAGGVTGGLFDTGGTLWLNRSMFLGNNTYMGLTDLSGTHPMFVVDTSNNFVCYGTNSSGGYRAMWYLNMRSDTSQMIFPVTPYFSGGMIIPNGNWLTMLDASGNSCYFLNDTNNVFNFYGTHANGTARQLFYVGMHSDTSAFAFSVASYHGGGIQLPNLASVSSFSTTQVMRNLIHLDGGNNMIVGDTNEIAGIYFYSGGVTSGHIKGQNLVWDGGYIYIPNNTFYAGYEANSTSPVWLAGVRTDNGLTYGAWANTGIYIGADGNCTTWINGNNPGPVLIGSGGTTTNLCVPLGSLFVNCTSSLMPQRGNPIGCLIGADAFGIFRTGNGSSGGTNLNLYDDASTGTFIWFGNASAGAGTAVGTISDNGNTVGYNGPSDYRIKANYALLDGAMDLINKVSVYHGEYRSHPGRKHHYFIAHELDAVIPHVVIGEKDAVNEHGQIVPQMLDPRHLVPTLWAGTQELHRMFTDLRVENDNLKGRVVALETQIKALAQKG